MREYNPLLDAVKGLKIDFSARARAAAIHSQQFWNSRPKPGEIYGKVGPWTISEEVTGFEWILDESLSSYELARYRTTRKRIGPKPDGCYRVVLVGESAAGSFGYWGEYNLAGEVEAWLEHKMPDRQIDVIDLSSVNATWNNCNDTLHHVFTLEPDVVVFYVGNNELKGLAGGLEVGEAMVREEQISARWNIYTDPSPHVGAQLVEVLATHCSNLLREAVSLCEAFGVDFVYVLPESNIIDWKPQERSPWCVSDHEATIWCKTQQGACASTVDEPNALVYQSALWETGRDLLKRGEFEQAMGQMREIGTCGLGSFVNAVPQTIPAVADVLRSTCVELNLPYVDLPLMFSPVNGELPSRKHFIDYCHLSETGIAYAAAGITFQLLKLMDDSCEPEEFVPRLNRASRQERFQGAMVGMLHTYHYGQPEENVQYWAEQAFQSGWDGALTFLAAIREITVQRTRERLTGARIRAMGLTSDEWDSRFNLYVTKFIYHARFDIALARIMDAAASSVGISLPELDLKDDVLESSGSLYCLYYLDHLKGFRPLARLASRGGWERGELNIILTDPIATVEFPIPSKPIERIQITFELIQKMSILVYLDDELIDQIEGLPGDQIHQIGLTPAKRQFTGSSTHILRLVPDRLCGITSLPESTQRYLWSLRYGLYPTWGRLADLRLEFA